MGSYAVVSIASYELFSTKNHFYEWHVTKADRKIQNERYFYEIRSDGRSSGFERLNKGALKP